MKAQLHAGLFCRSIIKRNNIITTVMENKWSTSDKLITGLLVFSVLYFGGHILIAFIYA